MFPLLLLFSLICLAKCVTLRTMLNRYDDPSLDRSELIYGIEISKSGATCAVSFPDGRFETIASINHSRDSKELMSRWEDLCTLRDGGTISAPELKSLVEHDFPNYALDRDRLSALRVSWVDWASFANVSRWDWILYKLGLQQRNLQELYALDIYRGDEATAILTRTLAGLHNAALESLLSNFNTTDFPDRPYAEIALPDFFFASLPVFLPDEWDPHPPNDTYIGSSHLSTFISRISTAVHRAGFRRTASSHPADILSQHAKGDHFAGPLASSSMAIHTAVNGVCDAETYTFEDCMYVQAESRISLPVLFINSEEERNGNLDPDFPALNIWLEGPNRSSFDKGVWNWWHVPADEVALRRQQTLLAEQICDQLDKETRIEVLAADHLWTWNFLSTLQEVLRDRGVSIQARNISEVGALAALGTAEEARYVWLSQFTCGMRYEPPDLNELMGADNQEL